MTVIGETRERLRAARSAAPQRPAWHPPALEDFLRGVTIAAFDASLVNTGWVVLRGWMGGIDVFGHGTIRPKTKAIGYMATWERALLLDEALQDTLAMAFIRQESTLMAVEAPSVGGGHRTESSLMAGFTVWRLAPDRCEPVSATRVSAVLLGDPRIKSAERKPAIREAVCRYVPDAAGRGWDEHQRDGLSVALTRLFDLKEAS